MPLQRGQWGRSFKGATIVQQGPEHVEAASCQCEDGLLVVFPSERLRW